MNKWQIWFHPGRALRQIASQHSRIAELEKECEEKHHSLTSVQNQLEDLQRTYDEQSREAMLYHTHSERLELRLLKLTGEKEELESALKAERADTQEAMAEISRRLEGIDEMKAAYERRISHLRHSLHDAHARLRALADIDAAREMDIIDIMPSHPITAQPKNENHDESKVMDNDTSPSESDSPSEPWLLPLPD